MGKIKRFLRRWLGIEKLNERFYRHSCWDHKVLDKALEEVKAMDAIIQAQKKVVKYYREHKEG